MANQPSTAALILAAGLGRRFGGRKLLTPIDGRPMLQHVLDLAAGARLDPVVVVLGADAEELLHACEWRAEMRVVNPRPEDGLSGSVRLGLAALAKSGAERVLMLLGDQPRLSLGQIHTILGTPGTIVVPRYAGVPGNPAVLDRSVWPLAAALEGDRGFVQLFAAQRRIVTYVDVPGTNPDIDAPADLAAI